jgi:hypothetical protein
MQISKLKQVWIGVWIASIAACGSNAENETSAGSATSGACVDIDVSTYETSCVANSDCIDVTAGTICDGYECICGGAAINTSGDTRYQAALSSVRPGPGPACQCPYLGRALCVWQGASSGVCTYCPSPGSGQPSPQGCPTDAPDGGFAQCIHIDASTYDTSCQIDSDCIDITPGTLCDGYECTCGGAAVNAGGLARYQAALGAVRPGLDLPCECPNLGSPRCVQGPSGGVCTYCPSSLSDAPIPAGCPSGK